MLVESTAAGFSVRRSARRSSPAASHNKLSNRSVNGAAPCLRYKGDCVFRIVVHMPAFVKSRFFYLFAVAQTERCSDAAHQVYARSLLPRAHEARRRLVRRGILTSRSGTHTLTMHLLKHTVVAEVHDGGEDDYD